jgi:hypothetical protein
MQHHPHRPTQAQVTARTLPPPSLPWFEMTVGLLLLAMLLL